MIDRFCRYLYCQDTAKGRNFKNPALNSTPGIKAWSKNFGYKLVNSVLFQGKNEAVENIPG